VLVSLAFLLRVQLLERWHRWRLGFDDLATRIDAAKRLAALSSERAIPALIEFLRSASDDVDLEEVLFDFNNRGVEYPLRGSPAWTARFLLAALRQGGESPPSDWWPGGRALYVPPPGGLKFQATLLFHNWFDADIPSLAVAAPVLVDALSDASPGIRRMASWALERIVRPGG
jgi:HEAT repeat protein